MTTSTYDPKNIQLVFAGHFVDGYGDGTFISIARSAPVFTDKVGVGGQVTRSRSHDTRASITVTLMQSSLSNDRLTEIMNNDLATPNGGGIGSLTIRDINGTALFTSANAWIESPPDVAYELEAATRDWIIRCDDLQSSAYGSLASR